MSMDRVILAAILVLLWLRPHSTMPPEAWLVDIGVLILLYITYPYLDIGVSRLTDWLENRRTAA